MSPEGLGFLSEEVHDAWNEMEAAIRLGDQPTAEQARDRLLAAIEKASERIARP
jgi:hypothetical protein